MFVFTKGAALYKEHTQQEPISFEWKDLLLKRTKVKYRFLVATPPLRADGTTLGRVRVARIRLENRDEYDALSRREKMALHRTSERLFVARITAGLP